MSETVLFDLPGYRLLDKVGHGGMGEVYRAEQIATRRTVAIKVLHRAKSDPVSLAAFRREAATLAQLEHPHVVPLYDFGDQGGTPFLVFRYLEGGTLEDRLAQEPVEVSTGLRWLEAAADALDEAHRRGIVHRDVKPSNLLLDGGGNLFLGDFGIAAAGSQVTESTPAGTAAYASPEQGRGERTGPASDVYSLAATAFEILTGRQPFQAETALGMIVRHIHDPVPSARALRPELPPSVDRVLAAGMAKQQAARPASCGALVRRLRSALEDEPTLGPASPADTLLAHGLPRAGSRKWIAPAAAVVVVGACLATIVVGGGLAATLSAATPTATGVPPPTVVFPTAAARLPILDDFSDPESGFAPKQADDGAIGYVDGSLEITSLAGGLEWFSPYQGLLERDLRVTVRARRLEGPALSEMGVVCRWQDADNYMAAAWRNDGQVSVWRKASGIVERLVDWTPVDDPRQVADDWLSLELTCDEGAVRLSVDSRLVAEVVDPSPQAGTIALMAGLLEEGQAVVRFDDLEVDRP